MEHIYTILSLMGGIIFLYFGAESLIRGGASFALRMGLPILVIGLTIIGFGTSTPELVVSLQASFEGKGDIAIGNVIGSNILNIGFILALSAIFRPIKINSHLVQFDSPIMLISALVLALLVHSTNTIGRLVGLVFVIGIVAYTCYSIKIGKREKQLKKEMEEEVESDKKLQQFRSPLVDLILMGGGFLLLFLGARLFLYGAIIIAKQFNISDAVIGLTIVALGTSLPELATSLMAMRKKHGDISIGNIVGSNIFNTLSIVGLAALVAPIAIQDIKLIDYVYMSAITLYLWILIQFKKEISRLDGALMMFSYIIYVCYLLKY